MSMLEIIRIPKLTLKSLDAVKEIIGFNRKMASTVCLTSSERVHSIGESISKYLHSLDINLKYLDNSSGEKLQKELISIKKIISLKNALADEGQELLEFLTEKKLSEVGIQYNDLVDKVDTLIKKKNLSDIFKSRSDSNSTLEILTEKVNEAHLELKKVEQTVIVGKSIEVLSNLGFKVKRKQLQNRTLIRGLKSNLSVAFEVNEESDLHIDLAGFDGNECKDTLKKLNRELEKQGIGLKIKLKKYHGKKSGGLLAQQIEKEFCYEFNPLVDIKRTTRQFNVKNNRLKLINRKRKAIR